jgi:hypothetical protein
MILLRPPFSFSQPKKSFAPDRRRMALGLALVLPLLRLSRASAQEENTVGYRHEFYREDNNRISVDTDSIHFDVGLGSHVRLNGEVVFDAISGATPTGAPPQTKWPFATFNDLYQNAYTQSYTSEFNSFITDNIAYAQAGYITFDQLTNAATGFAQTNAPGIATNSATASYRALTNSPSFHKTTVPLTHMHDFRSAFNLGVPVSFGPHLITPSFAYSTESDYISFGGALNYSLALNNKNTTLSAGYSHNSDTVRDDRFVWEEKLTDDFLLGLVQLISPQSYLTVNLTFGNETGYLADPYRGVMFEATTFDLLQTNPEDAALAPEKRPRHRTREIAYASWTQFIDPLDASAELSYRFFHDSFDIFAQTAGLTWNQKIGRRVVVSPYFRYYFQTAASFYYPVLVPTTDGVPPDVYSSDYRLSRFQSLSGGVKITYRVCRYASIDAGYMRYVMQGLDSTAPSAYPSANVFTIGLRIWF